MATVLSGPRDPAGTYARRDSSCAANYATSASYQQLFRLLWLYPDVSFLMDTLLEGLERSWHYQSAFLIEEILELQIIYRDYLGCSNVTQSVVAGNMLLEPDHVMRITRFMSRNIMAYNPDNFEDIIGRELQFKVKWFCFCFGGSENHVVPAD